MNNDILRRDADLLLILEQILRGKTIAATININ